jgi:two-component system sensor histidine kinase DevS
METNGDGEREGLGPPPDGARVALLEAGVLLASELSLPVLLRRLVELAVRITHARYGALGVLGPQGRIREFITVGMSEGERAAIGPIPQGRGILGALVHDPQPLRLERLQSDPRSVGFPPNHPLMATFLGAPVRAQGQVFGNLYLTEKESGRAFTEADEAAVVTLAGQAGVAIANAQTYRELKDRERWLQGLHEITVAQLAGQPREALLAATVRTARELGGADLAAVVLAEEGDPTRLLVIAADGSAADRVRGLALPAHGTASHDALASGRPLLIPHPLDARRQAWFKEAGVDVATVMVVPLIIRDHSEGTILLARTAPAIDFTSDDLSLLESFASQAALALEYARAQVELRRLAVLDERHRIARDLHDEPVQALIYLARRLEGLASETMVSGPAARQVQETRHLALAVVDGLRQLTEGLRSEILDHEGLVPALEDLAERFTSRTEIPVQVRRPNEMRRWSPDVERSLLRVAQEALSNVEHHAQAQRVWLGLAVRGSHLSLRIADNGIGFAFPGARETQGLGMLGMRERVGALGGQLLIRSRPGRGCVVIAHVPTDGNEGNSTTTGPQAGDFAGGRMAGKG